MNSRSSVKPQRILVIDDDAPLARTISRALADTGYIVKQAYSADEGLEAARREKFDLVLLDIRMHWGTFLNPLDTAGEERTGLVLAREIRRLRPQARIVAHTMTNDRIVTEWFTAIGGSVLRKTWDPEPVIRAVNRILRPELLQAQVFLVHGRDHETMNEVRAFLTAEFGWNPLVLADMPSRGMSVIEKFEHYAAKADLAVVIFTPDDMGHLTGRPGEAQTRPRLNVLFELGYFLGAMRRSSGRVILLSKGLMELPSDISGVVTIDISGGIHAAAAEIRRECQEYAATVRTS